jgi:hypothetical protein
MGSPTKKSRVKCTCHRIHKSGMFRRKCKLHKHYSVNNVTPSVKKRSTRRKRGKTNSKTSKHIKISEPIKKLYNRSKTYFTKKMPISKGDGVPKYSGNSQKLLDAIHKIQECQDLDQCGEIKNYISMNVCDPDSSNKDILFYYRHLSEKDQHTVYEKVTEFAKTI